MKGITILRQPSQTPTQPRHQQFTFSHMTHWCRPSRLIKPLKNLEKKSWNHFYHSFFFWERKGMRIFLLEREIQKIREIYVNSDFFLLSNEEKIVKSTWLHSEFFFRKTEVIEHSSNHLYHHVRLRWFHKVLLLFLRN